MGTSLRRKAANCHSSARVPVHAHPPEPLLYMDAESRAPERREGRNEACSEGKHKSLDAAISSL